MTQQRPRDVILELAKASRGHRAARAAWARLTDAPGPSSRTPALGPVDRIDQLLDRASTRPRACLQVKALEQATRIGVECHGKKFVGGFDVHAVAPEPVA
jgi:hypothetical protein